MKDVSLDDLIKEDKEKFKKNKKATIKNKKFVKKPLRNRQDNRNRPFDQNKRKFKTNRPINQNNSRPRNLFNNNQQPQFRLKRRPLNNQQKRSEQNVSDPVKEKGRTLKVLGLHPQFSNDDLYKLFSSEGALEKCLRESDDFGRQLPTALVKYHSADCAKKAIDKLNGKTIMNSVLTVEPYKRNNK